MNHSKILLFSSFLVFSQTVFALRCGHALVELGEYKEDIIEKCGEPETIDSHIERRAVSNFISQRRHSPNNSTNYGQQQYTEIEVKVEEWVYDFGHRKFQQYLRFENGRLKEIKRLGRGG